MKNKIFIKRILILISITAILALSLLLFPNDKVILKISDIRLQIEVADTGEERVKGLSDRESLGYRDGMLFIFSFYLVALLRAYPLQMIYHTLYGRSHS